MSHTLTHSVTLYVRECAVCEQQRVLICHHSTKPAPFSSAMCTTEGSILRETRQRYGYNSHITSSVRYRRKSLSRLTPVGPYMSCNPFNLPRGLQTFGGLTPRGGEWRVDVRQVAGRRASAGGVLRKLITSTDGAIRWSARANTWK